MKQECTNFLFTFVESFVSRGIGTGFARMKNNHMLSTKIFKIFAKRKDLRNFIIQNLNIIFFLILLISL